ncbi:hypothetical protein SEUCBS139899_006041 [Sporothrix eucalyptigena]
MPHTVYAFEKPPSPLRELGKVLLALLKTASGTLAEGAVETLAPLVFATIVILTTATAIVLYGIGHVGVSRLTESGVFGLTDESIDTLLGMVKMQWRFLRQLRWSWWLETAARYERRYEEQIDGDAHNDHHHEAQANDGHDHNHNHEPNCPIHLLHGYHEESAVVSGPHARIGTGITITITGIVVSVVVPTVTSGVVPAFSRVSPARTSGLKNAETGFDGLSADLAWLRQLS